MNNKIAIIVSSFNSEITVNLYDGAINCLKNNDISGVNIKTYWVPGSLEIPYLAAKLASSKKFDGIIALGAVIKGETAHFEYISESVTNSISKLSLKARIPIIYGILNSYDYNQAIKRASYNNLDKGGEAMKAAFQVIETYRKINN